MGGSLIARVYGRGRAFMACLRLHPLLRAGRLLATAGPLLLLTLRTADACDTYDRVRSEHSCATASQTLSTQPHLASADRSDLPRLGGAHDAGLLGFGQCADLERQLGDAAGPRPLAGGVQL